MAGTIGSYSLQLHVQMGKLHSFQGEEVAGAPLMCQVGAEWHLVGVSAWRKSCSSIAQRPRLYDKVCSTCHRVTAARSDTVSLSELKIEIKCDHQYQYHLFSFNLPKGGHQQRLGAEDHGPAGEGGRAHSQAQSEERAKADVRESHPALPSVQIQTEFERVLRSCELREGERRE